MSNDPTDSKPNAWRQFEEALAALGTLEQVFLDTALPYYIVSDGFFDVSLDIGGEGGAPDAGDAPW
jgi:hypothetical protein